MTTPSLRASILCIALLACANCSSLPTIDQYFTFNIIRATTFPLSNTIVPGTPTTVTAIGKIDTVTDYLQNGTATSLLRTSKITRIQLVPSDPAFSTANLSNTRLLIGPDTVGDSIYLNEQGEFLMNTTGHDVTTLVKDTSYTAQLQFTLQNGISNPVTITTYLTFVNTALPQ